MPLLLSLQLPLGIHAGVAVNNPRYPCRTASPCVLMHSPIQTQVTRGSLVRHYPYLEAAMNILRLAALGMALLIVGGCATDDGPTGPTTRSVAAGSSDLAGFAARRVEATGAFAANVDFATLTLTPRGSNCLLEVEGELVFTGTIQGSAAGRTSALVFAPCEEAGTNPPGTFADVFKSELEFEGTVDGLPASATLLYMGRVQPGGQIDGRLIFSNGVAGRLDAQAVVAVGGQYSGFVVVN
jgi:hypothetical protein